jgi:predicted GNAT family acetyltransferase
VKLARHQTAAAFLVSAQAALEQHEAANNLIVSIAVRLKEHPDRIKTPPYLATVERDGNLLAAAIMTPPQRVIIHAESADPAPLRLLADDLIAGSWAVPGDIGAAEIARAFAEVWAEVTGQRPQLKMHQRVYELRQVIHPSSVPGNLRVAVEADITLVAGWLDAFHQELGMEIGADTPTERARQRIDERVMFIWEDGQPVSLAGRSRHSTHGVCIGPVYTPPEVRRRGYAGACVAALSQQMLDAGWAFCTLFADLANLTSNSVYQRIGYRPVCDFDEYVFE